MPPYIEPMLATLASKPFSDPDWLYEIKWDGFRVQAVVNGGKVRTWTRGLKDAETYFPRLLSPPSWIDAKQAIVDGEVVALDEDGRPDFSLLQTKLGQQGVGGLVYQPFDLLYLDGRLAARRPARGSQATAPERAQGPPAGALRRPRRGDGEAFFEAAGANRLEGIIAKLRRSRYEPGRRSKAWLKLKVRPEQELVIGGWTPGEGNARDLGALAVGYYEDGKLQFAGKVGSGFTGAIRKELLSKLQPLVVDDSPFDAATEGLQGSMGRRSRFGDLGPAGARDARGARRLDARGRRPPGRVQGTRAGSRRHDRPSGERGRDDERGPCRRGRDAGGSRDLGDDVGHAPDHRRQPAKARKGTRRRERAAEAPRADRHPRRLAHHRRRARGARRPRQGRRLARRRRRPQADQPRQAAVRRATMAADHEARAHPLLRADRADDAAAPRRTGRSTCSGSRTAPVRPGSGRRTSRTPRRRG